MGTGSNDIGVNLAEQAVIGTLLLSPHLWPDVAKVVTPEMFAGLATTPVAATIWQRLKAKEDVNPAVIAGAVPGFNPSAYIIEADPANLMENADFIREEYIRRKECEIFTNAAARLTKLDPVAEVQAWVSEERAKLHFDKDRRDKKIMALGEVMYMASQAKEKAGFTGIHTGYNDLNHLTGGYQRGDLIITAARPSMGKTTLSIVQAVRAAYAGCPTLFISLEVSAEAVYTKAAAWFAAVDTSELRNGRMTDEDMNRFTKATDKLVDLPFWCESGAFTVDQIAALIWEYKRKHGIEICYIDYLQLITPAKERGKNREQEVAEMSRALKVIARAANIPVVCLAQLSRAVESRGGAKRPLLSDLRESGAVEQDADIVQFIYRPGYYGIKEDESGNDISNTVEVIIAKHRNGRLDTLIRNFVFPYTDFIEKSEIDNKAYYNPVIVRPADDTDIPF